MWYKKNLQIDELVAKIEAKEFSLIPERIMKFLVVNHCALHQINYKDRQRIVNKLGIPAVKLLTRS